MKPRLVPSQRLDGCLKYVRKPNNTHSTTRKTIPDEIVLEYSVENYEGDGGDCAISAISNVSGRIQTVTVIAASTAATDNNNSNNNNDNNKAITEGAGYAMLESIVNLTQTIQKMDNDLNRFTETVAAEYHNKHKINHPNLPTDGSMKQPRRQRNHAKVFLPELLDGVNLSLEEGEIFFHPDGDTSLTAGGTEDTDDDDDDDDDNDDDDTAYQTTIQSMDAPSDEISTPNTMPTVPTTTTTTTTVDDDDISMGSSTTDGCPFPKRISELVRDDQIAAAVNKQSDDDDDDDEDSSSCASSSGFSDTTSDSFSSSGDDDSSLDDDEMQSSEDGIDSSSEGVIDTSNTGTTSDSDDDQHHVSGEEGCFVVVKESSSSWPIEPPVITRLSSLTPLIMPPTETPTANAARSSLEEEEQQSPCSNSLCTGAMTLTASETNSSTSSETSTVENDSSGLESMSDVEDCFHIFRDDEGSEYTREIR